ncbi:GNAT family N-acetyltransferase [Desulfitobacterium sp.]|uniref:GNAT family N-acetyltransferase n=1 Tax=Desulfitobacterium sp. TaxID=49981 RepID=UPI002C69E6D5|nr:GNAT family N-acetyltransferase [Desulfitobacterium sp.]HVJ47625.1 GNAT family N-acetyltransferase [Desulfitobacterium sp.]
MQREWEAVEGIRFCLLAPDHWSEFEKLFGEHGADGGCWCMWWRLPEKQFEEQTGELNKAAMQELVESGQVPGFLAYKGDEPIAWCSVGPRERYQAIHRYWQLNRDEDKKTWSIVCFYVEEKFRRRGLMKILVEKAMKYAFTQGAKVIEGYPIEPDKKLAGFGGFTGILSVYKSLGFSEIDRNSRNEILMRFECED